MDTTKTEEQFKRVMDECRTLFAKKLHDYGASWRILRPSSLTDQLFIKAKRIRSLEITGTSLVGEGIRPEFIALINYGIIGLIQLEKGYVDTVDTKPEEALALYDAHAKECLELMLRKNHDYNEAWRDMRISSYTDFILTKIQRIKEIEGLDGKTLGHAVVLRFSDGQLFERSGQVVGLWQCVVTPLAYYRAVLQQNQSGIAAYHRLQRGLVGVAERVFGSRQLAPSLYVLICRRREA